MNAYKITLKSRFLNLIKRILLGPLLRLLFIKLRLNNKYRFLGTNVSAIGHLCVDVDCFLKESIIYDFSFVGILLANRRKVANHSLISLWKSNNKIKIIENHFLCELLDYLRIYDQTNYDCSKYMSINYLPGEVHKIYGDWKSSVPIIQWSPGVRKQAEYLFAAKFKEIDITKLVVFHCRDSKYDSLQKNYNEQTQNYRNGDLQSLRQIFTFLKENSYSIIRIGTYFGEDDCEDLYYTTHHLSKEENELNDVYISSQCACFIGSNSGAATLASIWNRPIFLTNFLPFTHLRFPAANCMAVPKILKIDNKILNATEIFENNFHWLRLDQEYKKNGISWINNQPDEILEDFKEFFQAYVKNDISLKEKLIYSNEMQRYRVICNPNSGDFYSDSLIPRNFFRKYAQV